MKTQHSKHALIERGFAAGSFAGSTVEPTARNYIDAFNADIGPKEHDAYCCAFILGFFSRLAVWQIPEFCLPMWGNAYLSIGFHVHNSGLLAPVFKLLVPGSKGLIGFAPLPEHERGHSFDGGKVDNSCLCVYCSDDPKKSAPNNFGVWDTFAVVLGGDDHSWKCHAPELRGEKKKRRDHR